VLDPAQIERLFNAVRSSFDVSREAEITVECAPGTLSAAMLDSLVRCGVNRVSLGVQSFVDQEAAAVGRIHDRATVIEDIARLRSAGVANISVDLIAGLPHQTSESWQFSLSETIASGVPHVSVYMLEVDEESRLGRELLAGGTRYHAHFVPNEEAVTDFYLAARERLQAADIAQYEISNFAREGFRSRHNLKYWTRAPYFGFGVDAHSMLVARRTEQALRGGDEGQESELGFSSYGECIEAVRFSATDSVEQFVKEPGWQRTKIGQRAALEEEFFLGLRLSSGINLKELVSIYGEAALSETRAAIDELVEDELIERRGDVIRLTTRGRLLSNDVFERFIV
jgi:oxygen-independent coproporphyrinogen-3 oxidase